MRERSGFCCEGGDMDLNLSRSSVVRLSMLVLLLTSSSLLRAQVTNGINGVITDISGASVANAHVRIVNTATGVESDAYTSSSGSFNLVGLSPGEYSAKSVHRTSRR